MKHAQTSTQATLAAITETTSAEISAQFDEERSRRGQELNRIVSAVDEAASNAVAKQFELERETNRALQEAARERHLQATYIAEGFQIASTARHAISEYYLSTGRFPRSNREAGLPEPTTLGGQALTSLVVSFEGDIILNYNAKSGVHRGMIRLTPDVRAEHMIRWQCRSRNFRNISEIAPQCEFDPST